MAKQFQIGVRADWADVQFNTEDGPVWRTVDYFSVCASDAKGYCYILEGFSSEKEEVANSKVWDVRLSNNNPDTHPEAWGDMDPIYGSEAYDELGCEQDQITRELYPEVM
jgi:hypothetical protein